MGFKITQSTGKHSKFIFFYAMVDFPTTKNLKKSQKKPNHVQKYDLSVLKAFKSVDNMDTNDWKRKKWSKSRYKRKVTPNTRNGRLV